MSTFRIVNHLNMDATHLPRLPSHLYDGGVISVATRPRSSPARHHRLILGPLHERRNITPDPREEVDEGLATLAIHQIHCEQAARFCLVHADGVCDDATPLPTAENVKEKLVEARKHVAISGQLSKTFLQASRLRGGAAASG